MQTADATLHSQCLRAQAALREGRLDLLRSDSERLLDQARKWAEEDDPEKTITELFGYRITADMRKALYAFVEADRLIAWGGHSTSKTWGVGGGYIFGHCWYAGGSVLAEDGRPRGGLLVLMAGKLEQIKRTSWETVRRHAEFARRNGHPILGQALPVDVGWRADAADPLRWSIVSQPYRAKAKASKERALQSEAGLKHDFAIYGWAEEFDTIPEQMVETVRGWDPLRKLFAAFNPQHAGAAIKSRLRSPEWETANFSALRWEPLLERRHEAKGDPCEVCGLAPGHDVHAGAIGISHLKLEAEMRDPARCQPLPTGKDPDPAKGHFLYALPEADWLDKPGPRADGVPGHPDATPRWYVPGENFTWQRVGIFPAESEALVFSPAVLEAAADLWRSLESPTWGPSVAGIDTAAGGPDRVIEAANFGRDPVDLWLRYQGALSRKLDPAAAARLAMRCPACEGTGCGICWEGLSPFYLGRPRQVPKPGDDAEKMAAGIAEAHGIAPLYRLDAAPGFWLKQPLERLRCRAELVHFGTRVAPERQVAGQRQYLNERARMFGVIAMAAAIGCAAIPPPELGPLEAELHDALGLPEWESVLLQGETWWKLPDKGATFTTSPDSMDAAGLAGGAPAAMPAPKIKAQLTSFGRSQARRDKLRNANF